MSSVPGVESEAGSDPRAAAYRRRLLDGLAETIRTVGYRQASVADVVRHAKTSRRTFYEHFTSLDDCYVALMRQENARIISTTAAAVDPSKEWTEQVADAISAWSRAAVEEPALVRSWIRDLGAIGGDGRDLQRELLQSFLVLVNTLTDTEEVRAAGLRPPTREQSVVLLGGLRELLATAFEDDIAIEDVARAGTDVAIAILGLNKLP